MGCPVPDVGAEEVASSRDRMKDPSWDGRAWTSVPAKLGTVAVVPKSVTSYSGHKFSPENIFIAALLSLNAIGKEGR